MTTEYGGYDYDYQIPGVEQPLQLTYVDGWWGTLMSQVAENSNIRNRCDVECRKKIGDRKVNYLVALAEARKTYTMLSSNVMTLVTALRAARRADWGSLSNTLGVSWRRLRKGKPLASRHLEFQYGWLPLMADIHGTAELLKQQINRPLLIRATRHISDQTDVDLSMIQGWGDARGYLSSAKGSIRRDHSTTLYGQIDDQYLRFAQQIGLPDPLTLGWELIPYSFVVDWALPVGTMLEALSAIYGVKFVGGYRGLHGQLDITYVGKLRNEYWFGTPGQTQYSAFSYQRSPMGDWPQVRPYFKSPFTGSNAWNALALLRQLFK
jgi:hypothetical protein